MAFSDSKDNKFYLIYWYNASKDCWLLDSVYSDYSEAVNTIRHYAHKGIKHTDAKIDYNEDYEIAIVEEDQMIDNIEDFFRRNLRR